MVKFTQLYLLISGGLLLFLLAKRTKGDIQHGLNDNIKPTRYQLDLLVPADAFTEGRTFYGNIAINLIINETTTEIPIHTSNQIINNVSLFDETEVLIATPTFDNPSGPTSGLVILRLCNEIPVGSYVLKLSYSGDLSPTSMVGFYKSSYLDDDNKIHYLLATQFESEWAREAFPSFDVPYMKANFKLSISFPKDLNLGGISNTEAEGPALQDPDFGENIKVSFKEKNNTSTYLLAFVISDFIEIIGEKTIKGIPTNLYTRNETINLTSLAVDLAPKLLDAMANFTYIDYTECKMSQVALPDFSAGAMENWGLVTYRDVNILTDERESPNLLKQKVATVIAHEFAHQWFGDLVTLEWWSDIFLNEGFATYFQYHILDEMEEYNAWQLPNQMVLEQLQTALAADSSDDSIPLHFDIEEPDKSSGKFNYVHYNKGSSVLRMVHHFLTKDLFQQGLRHYIQKYQYQNVKWTDLWEAFDDTENEFANDTREKLPDTTMRAVMEKWTIQPGYPLLTVKIKGSAVTIEQEPFLTSESNVNVSSYKWYIPITYTSSVETNVKTSSKTWLTPDSQLEIQGIINSQSDWIILNNQQTGYYRVNYDEKLWQRIARALSTRSNSIHTLNRAQIVDDLLTFALHGKKDLSTSLNLLRQILSSETNYFPWYSALAGFKTLIRRIGNTNNQKHVSTYVSELFKAIVNQTTFDHQVDHVESLKQTLVQTWSCKLGNEQCIKTATDLFDKFLEDQVGNRIDPNLRSCVYCNALRYSNLSTMEDKWNHLWQVYETTKVPSEKSLILEALGCTKDTDLLHRYLSYALSDDEVGTTKIRRQDAKQAFTSVVSNNPEGVNIAFQYLVNNYNTINKHFDDKSTFTSLFGTTTDYFTSNDQITRASDFIETIEDQSIKSTLQESVDAANKNLLTTSQLDKQLTTYFEGNNASTFLINPYIALIVLLVVTVVY